LQLEHLTLPLFHWHCHCLMIKLFVLSFLTGWFSYVQCGDEAVPLPVQDWKDKRVMMISAHPDDIEWTCGGLVYQLTQLGIHVFYLIITNGDKGCGNPMCFDINSQSLAQIRYKEAINAASLLGVNESSVIQLDYEDAMLESYHELQVREDIVRALRQYQPHIVMTWFPYPQFSLLPSQLWSDMGFHPDHQQAGRLALSSQFDSGVGRLWPLSGAAWSIQQFYMWDFIRPTHYVDIKDQLDVKVASYCAHVSQVASCEVEKGLIALQAERVANLSSIPNGSVQFAEGFRAYF